MAIFEKKLDDEKMKDVNGGYIYPQYIGHSVMNDEQYYRYEVIDDKTGNVITFFEEMYQAKDYAEAHGQSVRVLEWKELEQLRKDAGTIK